MIRVAVVGAGYWGPNLIRNFAACPETQLVAVCDRDEKRLAKAIAGFPGATPVREFDELLGRADVDAVVIIVPDHWHAIMTIMAAKAGKDIYCEKPLSLTVRDGRAMVKAVRQYKRVLQTGTMNRSNPHARYACELVRNGRIGQLKRIVTDVRENNVASPAPGWQPMPVPDGFDYETWLGPAPSAPYHASRCLYRFRFIRDYSGGQTTNFGAHSNDLAQWGHGSDGSGPIEFEDQGSEFPEPGCLFNTPTKIHFRARYADGVELVCQTTKRGFGLRFEGTEGWVDFGYQGVTTSPESLKDSVIGPNEVHLPMSNKDRERGSKVLAKLCVPDHAQNFLDCIKSREDPVARVEIGHSTANICHLGNIAMLLHRKIRWDPDTEQIAGDDEAAALLSRPMRAPWTI
jgi:hypothetical protein